MLKQLWCKQNNLTELPKLPIIHLAIFSCYGNNLKELPVLPLLLQKFWCYENKLTELPELPVNIKVLYCQSNYIKYLSRSNCTVIKNIKLNIMDNPVSSGFDSNREFQDSL
jgi:hypothetical protein